MTQFFTFPMKTDNRLRFWYHKYKSMYDKVSSEEAYRYLKLHVPSQLHKQILELHKLFRDREKGNGSNH
jgi:hypothetical protein